MRINYDHLAAEYARHRRVHPEVLKDLVAAGHIKSSSRVLEAGCGTGNYLLALRESAGCTCCGIDPSEGMLEKARSRSASARFVQGQAERLDFPPDSFDLVFSVDVIHHVRDRQAYFSEARRVLSAGGRFCTVTDSEWIIRHRRPLTAYFPETAAVELGRYPPVPDLLALLARAGFQQIEARQVEFPYLLTDAQPYRDKAFSSLHLIPEEAFKKGIAHLEQDLAQGPIASVSYYVLLWGTKCDEHEYGDVGGEDLDSLQRNAAVLRDGFPYEQFRRSTNGTVEPVASDELAKQQAEVREIESGFVPFVKAVRAAIETNSVENVMGELRREVRALKSPKAR